MDPQPLPQDNGNSTYLQRLVALKLLRENMYYANPGTYAFTDVAHDIPGVGRYLGSGAGDYLPSKAIISEDPEVRKKQIKDAIIRIKSTKKSKSSLGKEVLRNAANMGLASIPAGFLFGSLFHLSGLRMPITNRTSALRNAAGKTVEAPLFNHVFDAAGNAVRQGHPALALPQAERELYQHALDSAGKKILKSSPEAAALESQPGAKYIRSQTPTGEAEHLMLPANHDSNVLRPVGDDELQYLMTPRLNPDGSAATGLAADTQKVWQWPTRFTENIRRLFSKNQGRYRQDVLRRSINDSLYGAGMGVAAGTVYPILAHNVDVTDSALSDAEKIMEEQPYLTSLPTAELLSVIKEKRDNQMDGNLNRMKNMLLGTGLGAATMAAGAVTPGLVHAGLGGAKNLYNRMAGNAIKPIFTPNVVKRMRNDAVSGAMLGGVMGGVTGAFTKNLIDDENKKLNPNPPEPGRVAI